MDNIKELHNAIRNEEWDLARTIKITPKKVEHSNELGYNALHWAIWSKFVPLDILHSLLIASDNAPLAKKIHGETPLNYALRRDCSDEIILMTIEACPQAVLISNNDAFMPIYYAVLFERSTEILQKLLLDQNHQCNFIPRHLQLFFNKWETELERSIRSNSKSVVKWSSYVGETIIKDKYGKVKKIKEVCDRTILLLQCVVPNNDINNIHSKVFQTLEACLTLKHCPWSFFFMILSVHPHEAWTCNKEGNILLHTAIHIKNSAAKKTSIAIEHIVTINPKSATIPNNNGRLPLNLAIESTENLDDGVWSIFKVCPFAIATRDVVTHMYPFMLAAVARKNDETSQSTSDIGLKVQSASCEDACLQMMTTSFALLMESPHIIPTLRSLVEIRSNLD